MNDNDNWKGNVSTILTWVWVIVAPYLADYFTQESFVTLGVAIVGIIIAVWSSCNPNSFKWLGNGNEVESVVVENEEDLINDEYFE